MKRIFLSIAIALAALPLYSKELAKNPITNMTLYENAGIYSIKGDAGIILLGNKDHAKEFISTVHRAILKETINDIFDCGKDQFEVGKDDQGYYVIKVGLGGAKIRYSDTVLFGTALGLEKLEPAAKKVKAKVQDAAGKLIDKL